MPPEHPFYQRWANDPFPIVALDRALDREHFTSVVGADQDDAEMLAEELRKFPAETVLYLGALPELSVSFLREQGFRTAWKDDPREVHFLYANSYERRQLPSYSKMAGNASDAAGAVHNVVCVVARGDGCHATSRRQTAF